ncbi:MAG: hypothetical protein V7L05_16950 [Nostoc sp.]|uniref:hypothetical protein n=1 Tax=Nostoc sp. TaxID=1180 RepID=UPI002FFAE68A
MRELFWLYIINQCNSDVYDGLRLRNWLNVVQLRKFLCEGKGIVTKKQADLNCIGLSPRRAGN